MTNQGKDRNILLETAKNYAADAVLTEHDGACVLLLFFPYHPLDYPSGVAGVDGYYIASNRSYFAANAAAEALRNAGYDAFRADLPLRTLAVKSGKGTRGKNALFCHEKYGSFVVLQGIVLRGIDATEKTGAERTKESTCGSCRICIDACPVGAIGKHGVEGTRCLRYRQEHFDVSPEGLNRAPYLLGCGICQRVCPKNRGIPRDPAPEELNRLLQKEGLEKRFLQRNERLIFAGYFGKNYAGQEKLQKIVQRYLQTHAEKSDTP